MYKTNRKKGKTGFIGLENIITALVKFEVNLILNTLYRIQHE